jgi:Tautomerase enzyme
MPLVRIDLNEDAPAERVRIVSQAVYGAMIEIANAPINDKFQIVTRHSTDEIIYPEEGYLGVRYSPDLIIIQVTWVGGRSTDVKSNSTGALPTKFTPRPASAKRMSGSTWWMTGAKTGLSATATCSTHRSRSERADRRGCEN